MMLEQTKSRISRRSLVKAAAAGAGLAAASPGIGADATWSAPALHRLPSKAQSAELRLWHLAFPPHDAGFQALIEQYNETVNSNVTFTVESLPWAEYATKIRAATAAGNAPDLFCRTGTDLGVFASGGYLLPLTPNVASMDEVKSEWLAEYYLQSAPWGDIFAMGVPDALGDAGLAVNVDLLQAAGLDVLDRFESTDQLFDYAEQLTVREGDQVLRAGLGANGNNNPIYWLSYIVEQGGRFWDNEAQQFDFNTPEAAAALQFFADIYQARNLDSMDLPPDGEALGQGVKAMAFMWPEFPFYAQEVFPELNFAFTMKPPFAAGGRPPIVNHTDTWNLYAYEGTANREAVEDFLRFVKSPEAQLTFAEHMPGLAILKQVVFEDPFYQTGKGSYLTPVIDSIRDGQERFYGPWGNSDALVYDIWWPLMQEVLQGQATVEDALPRITEASNADLAEFQRTYPDNPETIIYWEAEELPEGLSWGPSDG